MKRLLTLAREFLISFHRLSTSTPWISAKLEYESFPLYLRYPASSNLEALQPDFPLLTVVTLVFEKVHSDGLPEGPYNRTLENLDLFIVRSLSRAHCGQCVLVETFGGKRTFYAYVRDALVATSLSRRLAKSYMQHRITIEIEPDPNWSFIRRYDNEHNLYAAAAQ